MRILLLMILTATSCSAQFSEDRKGIVVSDNNRGLSANIVDGDYIGGLNNGRPQYGKTVGGKSIVVNTKDQLLSAIATARPGAVIYVDDKAVIDLTGAQNVVIPSGVTIASGRGVDGSPGGTLLTRLNGTECLFRIEGKDVRITGLRIIGPDSAIIAKPAKGVLQTKQVNLSEFSGPEKEYRQKMYGVPASKGVSIYGENVEIDNCEFAAWTFAAIMLWNTASKVRIHHNYIHHNLRFGLGYGVCMDGGTALITANLFDYNGHSVTGTGKPNTVVEVCYNIFGENHLRAWPVDMHGGKDRKDGTNVAGDRLLIHHNNFRLYNEKAAVVIRGVPLSGGFVYNNKFTYLLRRDQLALFRKKAQKADATYSNAVSKIPDQNNAIKQKNVKGNLYVFDNMVVHEK